MSRWMMSIPLVAALVLSSAARADVHDQAKVFGAAARADADSAMSRMERQYEKQLIVETYPSVPPHKRDELARDKVAFFRAWKVERASALKANGVYVLVCMEPRYIEVGAGKNTVARGIFTDADLAKLREGMRARLAAKDFDGALAFAVNTVAGTYADRIPGAVPIEPMSTARPTTRATTQPTTGPAR